jgi:hypothetical protein
MEGIVLEIHAAQLLITNATAFGTGCRVKACRDREAGFRFCVADQIKLTTVSLSSGGRPRQFLERKLNRRCSILFHLFVSGGKCETWIVRWSVVAIRCSFVFQRRTRLTLLPPPSARDIEVRTQNLFLLNA